MNQVRTLGYILIAVITLDSLCIIGFIIYKTDEIKNEIHPTVIGQTGTRVENTVYDEPLDESELAIGQVWFYESQNPFDGFSDTMKITDLKRGYVKYHSSYMNRSDNTSVGLFKLGARRIK